MSDEPSVFWQLLTSLPPLALIAGGFAVPLKMVRDSQQKTNLKVDVLTEMLNRDVLSKDDTEKLIKLYTDPIKEELKLTRQGIEKLMEQFRSLEILIARELGSNGSNKKASN